MKKIYSLLAMSTLVVGTFAQEKTVVSQDFSSKTTWLDFSKDQTQTKALESHWIDYTVEYKNFNGTTPSYGIASVFTDSTVLVNGSTQAFNNFISSVGQLYDLDADIFTGGGAVNIDANHDFVIDSILVGGVYERVNTSVVDTLVVKVITPSAANLNQIFTFGGQLVPTYGDTIMFMDLKWDASTLTTPGITQEYKIILDDAFYADSTSNGLHYGAIQANLTIPGQVAGKFAVALEFRPGQTSWNINQDTLGVSINGWNVLYAELEGTNTYPTYEKGNFNCGYILTTDQRYGLDPNWTDDYIPMYAYGQSFPFESYEILFKVTQDATYTGVKENGTGVKLGQNMPNPFNANSVVNFELNSAEEVSFEIVDITGKVVKSIKLGNLNAGVHTVNIDASELNSGVYFYSVITGGNKVTNRMIVQK